MRNVGSPPYSQGPVHPTPSPPKVWAEGRLQAPTLPELPLLVRASFLHLDRKRAPGQGLIIPHAPQPERILSPHRPGRGGSEGLSSFTPSLPPVLLLPIRF